MKAANMQNPIEKVVPLLSEVGDRLLTAAGHVEVKLVMLAAAEAEVQRLKRDIDTERGALTEKVNRHYVDSEIETADVLCNRLAARKVVSA